MFWDVRGEEEVFLNRPKVEKKRGVRSDGVKIKEAIKENSNPAEAIEKLNKITEQINLISRYLTFLSEKFDKTIDSAVTYDMNLDEIEGRINNLRQRIDNLEILDSSVGLERSAGRAV